MSGIFISYRRDDSAASAGRLCDRLGQEFGADKVFMDVDDIPPGADFSAHIGAKIGACDAFLAVIGKRWLSERLDDPRDLVSREIALALQRKILVIPVLVEGAAMPKRAELIPDLKALAQRNAVTVGAADFHRDSAKLITALRALPGLAKPTAPAAPDWRAEMRQRLRRRLIWKIPLIVLLVGFAVWWQLRQQTPPPSPPAHAALAAKLAGRWHGEVTYPWGVKYNEQFFFTPEGNQLFGTASFLGTKRGMEEGRIVGQTITFEVRYEEMSGDQTRTRTARYEGTFVGEQLSLRFFDDAGGTPVEFALKRE